jgi:uncharacterized protein (DUF111 family)
MIIAEVSKKLESSQDTLRYYERIGLIPYGIGHRDLEIPNVLRVYLGEKESFEEVEGQFINKI